jgi:hypothetical protein
LEEEEEEEEEEAEEKASVVKEFDPVLQVSCG